MLGDVVGDAKAKIANTLRAAMWGAIAAAAGIAAFLFFLIGLFIWTADRYDAVVASVTLGIVLACIAMLAATAFYMMQRRKILQPEKKRPAVKAMWLDPVLVTAGLDVARALGGRRTAMLMLGALATTWILTGIVNGKAESRSSAPRDRLAD
jgi:hypothetical protein